MFTVHERKIKRKDDYEWEVYSPRTMNATLKARYAHINKIVNESNCYSPIFLNDPRRRFDYLYELSFEYKVFRFSYTSTKEHLHFIWKVKSQKAEKAFLELLKVMLQHIIFVS